MGARHKLNKANLLGALLLAGAVGAVAQSWVVLAVAAAVLVVAAVHSGDIRFK